MNTDRRIQPLVALSQLLNTLLGGWADESLSARSWRKRDDHPVWSVARFYIDALFFWDPNHCERAWRAEVERAQLPVAYRTNPPLFNDADS